MGTFRGIFRRLTFGYLFLFNQIFLTIILIAVVVIYSLNLLKEEHRHIYEKLEPELASEVEEIDISLQDLENNVFKLKSLAELFDSINRRDLLKAMQSFVGKNLAPHPTQYNGFFAFAPEMARKYFDKPYYIVTVHRNYSLVGTQRYSDPEYFETQIFTDGWFYSDPTVEWWHMNKVDGKIAYSNFYFDRGFMEKVMFTTATGLFRDGRLVGVLGIDTLASDMAQRLGKFRLGETGGLVVTNDQGQVVLPLTEKSLPMMGWVHRMAKSEAEFLSMPVYSDFAFDITNTNLREIKGSDGKKYLILSKALKKRPWHVILYQEKNEAYANFYPRWIFFLLMSAEAYLALSFVVWVSWRYVSYRNQEAFLALKESRDRAEAATRAKSSFLSTMSHEIRTPLNAMLGVTELLSETKLDSEQARYTTTLQQAGESLLSVLNNILDFSKIESGKVTIENIEFKLSDLLGELSNLVEPMAAKKGLRFVLIHPEQDELVLGDFNHLRQVLMNLLGNAVKFTQQGEIRLIASTESSAEMKRKQFYFEVSDTGIGIAKENLHHIFDDFRQEDSSITRRFGGTGLGLSISRKIVQLMGSDINCISEVGKGSSFQFILTLPGKSLALWQKNQRKLEERPRISSLRILIVDDMEDNHGLLRAYLKKAQPAVVDSAYSGQECLQKCSENSYDIIFMDVQMPGMSGIETIHRLREKEKMESLSRTPVVVISANDFPEDYEKSLAAGADDHCGKPIRKDRILLMLEKHCPGWSVQSSDS